MTSSPVREKPDEVESLTSGFEAESGEAIPRLRLTRGQLPVIGDLLGHLQVADLPNLGVTHLGDFPKIGDQVVANVPGLAVMPFGSFPGLALASGLIPLAKRMFVNEY